MGDKAVRRLPRFLVGFPDDHVQTDAKTHLATMPGGFLSHLSYFLCHLGRRFSPGKIKIDLLSGQLLRYLRRAAEIEGWTRLLQWRKQQFGVANALMLAVKGDGFSLHQLAPDVGKFSRGLIALGVVEEDAVACQFGRIAAGDQIEQRPAV